MSRTGPAGINAWKKTTSKRFRFVIALAVVLGLIHFLYPADQLLTSDSKTKARVASVQMDEAEAPAPVAEAESSDSSISAEAHAEPPADTTSLSEKAAAEPQVEQVEAVIKSGQTAAAILKDNLSPMEIHELAAKSKDVFPLTKLRAGKKYRITTMDDAFSKFEYEIDNDEVLVISKNGDGFDLELKPIQYDIKTEVVSGTVTSNLFDAVKAAGEKPALAVQIADVFAWDVDFCRDIRKGDSFKAVVEKRYRDGKFAGYGKMPVAQFVNQGDAFRGFLYPDENGRMSYYDESGKALRKVFLKSPLSFTRISSGFTYSRLHPVLKYRRPHTGIDYAAPRGTPVWTVGDGKVIAASYNKAAGKYVKVRHNSVYTTQYNHLSGYGRGIKVGKRVTQGQVIGYVGATGLATGPHLDFRMSKNGTPVNPRRMKSPSVEPLAKNRMPAFHEAIEPFQAMLGDDTKVAAR